MLATPTAEEIILTYNFIKFTLFIYYTYTTKKEEVKGLAVGGAGDFRMLKS
jgi:hypothetical protein